MDQSGCKEVRWSPLFGVVSVTDTALRTAVSYVRDHEISPGKDAPPLGTYQAGESY